MNAIAAKSSIRAPRLRLARDLARNKGLYLMVLPVLLYYFLFHYAPMYGAVIAFKEFSPARGILQSSWAAPWYKHFVDFFGSFYFLRVLANTVFISINSLLFSFPAPILLALLLNELRVRWFSRTVQTMTYMPHFVSLVVFCGLVREFTMDSGFINQVLSIFGWNPVTMLSRAVRSGLRHLGYLEGSRLGIDHLPGGFGEHRSAALRSRPHRRGVAPGPDLARNPAGHRLDRGHPADPQARPHHECRFREDHSPVQPRHLFQRGCDLLFCLSQGSAGIQLELQRGGGTFQFGDQLLLSIVSQLGQPEIEEFEPVVKP
jgi:hypothetical protein